MSVFVIDCTTIGVEDPTGTWPTQVVTVCRRSWNATLRFLVGCNGKILCAGGTDCVPSLTAFQVVATLAVALEPGFGGCRKLGLNGVAPRNMVLWRTVLSGAGQCVRLER